MKRGCVFLLLSVYLAHATENAQMSPNEPRKAGTYVVWPGDSTEEINLRCPGFLEPLTERGVRGGFTEQCESRLDQEFLGKIPIAMPIHANDSTLIWQYVFDEPLVKQKIVLKTLADPNCMITEVRSSGDELVDRCRVNTIADYAVLKYMCTGALFRIHKFIEDGYDPSRYLSAFERLFDNDSYWKKRWRQEYLFYHHGWIAAKCAGVPQEAFVSLGMLDDTTELREIPTPGEDDWWWIEQGIEAYRLLGVVDRLSSNLVRAEYGYKKETLTSWQAVDPIMAEFIKVNNPGDYPHTAEAKAARLKHFIAASTHIKIWQANIDQDWLLKQVGEFSDDELTQAAEDATEMMSKQRGD